MYCSALRMTEASPTPTPSSLNRDRPALEHRSDLRQFLPFASLGDRSDGIHIGQPDSLGLPQDKFDLPFVIERRLGVGHAADGGEPPRHRRRRPAGDRLLLLIARLTKMHMNSISPGVT